MNIDKDILMAWGGKYKKYKKHEMVFEEGQEARFFHQVVEGGVRMFNINDSAGKEFTLGMFMASESFGEPPVIINEVYPAHAECVLDSVILTIPRDNFIRILHEYPNLHFQFTKLLAQRAWDRAITLKETMSNTPATRILGFLKSYKKKMGNPIARVFIPFTRQEIANFTGLRVETTIRTINKMGKEGLLSIDKHKIYF
ncbi:MAG: Crp/Fnr family transcriptional regulator [Chitinophagaceae bacterium]